MRLNVDIKKLASSRAASSRPFRPLPFRTREEDGHLYLMYQEGRDGTKRSGGKSGTILIVWYIVYYVSLGLWGVLLLGYLLVFASYVYTGFTQ